MTCASITSWQVTMSWRCHGLSIIHWYPNQALTNMHSHWWITTIDHSGLLLFLQNMVGTTSQHDGLGSLRNHWAGCAWHAGWKSEAFPFSVMFELFEQGIFCGSTCLWVPMSTQFVILQSNNVLGMYSRLVVLQATRTIGGESSNCIQPGLRLFCKLSI
jgi:hypothetical protein